MFKPIVPGVRCGAMLLLVLSQCGLTISAAADPIQARSLTLLDSLGGVATETLFDVNLSPGVLISANQFVGPAFNVAEPTLLTEVGAFARVCSPRTHALGCLDQAGLIVQIRPALNGVPDVSNVIASAVLSNREDLRHLSFETAAFSLALEPGDYFALFAPEARNFGTLLLAASSPFPFTPPPIRSGIVNPIAGLSQVNDVPMAVRILGVRTPAPVPEPSTLLLVGGVVAIRGLRQHLQRR